ncbi:peptidoglycan editing factor PgeF [Lysinibacillus piscis]|uniref:Purine nucleoside phosphorylase n=1 Tax=Lysinibacillus piscis TaxID=2518931 RepID=A0ABQ5NFZ7_9BACI|nr:peptidoglycan editing factor PgeF [Lysinibacillus sp. KH24]GLC87033.1 laccase domain protein YlmD [Lysinibacillus sp. KH24]
MKVTFYEGPPHIIAGTTLKDEHAPEYNNMALHICTNQAHIIENRQQLASMLGIPLEQFVCMQQTHSANFHCVTHEDAGRGAMQMETAIANTDALYTLEPNVLLCGFTADCVPVIFYNEVKGLVGVVHSGWQGTVREITSKLLQHLMEQEHCQPQDFHVHIGMALSQQCFEVDGDVYEQFHRLGYADDFIVYNEKTNKYHIDNQQTVKRQCELAGIPAQQIQMDTTCTYTSAEGFSYRQDKQAGRHISFIMLQQK